MKDNKKPTGGLATFLIIIVAALILRKIIPALAKLFVVLCILAAIGFVVLMIAVIIKGFKGDGEEHPKGPNNAEILSAGSSSQTLRKIEYTEEQKKAIKVVDGTLSQCKIVNNTIRDAEVRESANVAIAAAEKIVAVLKDQPDEIKRLHQLMNYYVPTLNAVISKFKTLEKSNTDVSTSKTQMLAGLSDITKALGVQYDKLFANEALDMSVEMEALQMALKRDGLLTDAEIPETAAAEITKLNI